MATTKPTGNTLPVYSKIEERIMWHRTCTRSFVVYAVTGLIIAQTVGRALGLIDVGWQDITGQATGAGIILGAYGVGRKMGQ